MYIKEAYERRIEEEAKIQSPNYLAIRNKSPVIGSKKVGRLNFDPKEAFFTENDISQKSKTLKHSAKQFKDPDILQLNKQKWNISVESPRNFDKFNDSQKDTLFKIKHGFYDFLRPIKQTQKQIYAGIDTRNNFKGWNVSTQITKRQKLQNMHNLTINSLDHTIEYNTSKLSSYIKLFDRYNLNQSTVNQRQINEMDLKNTFKQQQKYKHNNPNSSPQKTNAVAFRLLEEARRQRLKEILLVNNDQLEITKKFKANLTNSQKVNIFVQYSHNGIWSKTLWTEKGYAWSCCLNQNENSRGCAKKVVDLNRPNYSSFNNS